VAQFSSGQSQTPVTLDSSESVFSVLAAMNACGYNAGLAASDPIRAQIRQEIDAAVQNSDEAQAAKQALCQYYAEHQESDSSSTLSEYESLALFLGPPPVFATTVKDTDLAPDARGLIGMMPLLQKFYIAAGLHAIWQEHRQDYSELTARYHVAVSKLMFDTEIYLKLPSFGYQGRQFTVYLQPMGNPGQINARNYGSNYYVVVSPGMSGITQTDQIRHTYLHYLLDPLVLKYPARLEHLSSLLAAVQNAPMDQSFKSDAGLLVTECMIRAVEIRMSYPASVPESERQKAVQAATKQGFVLTPYFYNALAEFEKGPSGIENAYGDILAGIDVRKETKAAEQVQFASTAEPELLHVIRPAANDLLANAEQKLSVGDAQGAQKLAEQALNEKAGDAGQAFFIMAQVASMESDVDGAQRYFQKALETSHEAKIVAWSHIYLGRILDLREDRAGALGHYRAALTAAAALPEAKAAAERGIEKPYAPPVLSR
jgi:tetratricopeptide (TPR) repeat protein